MPRTCNHLPGAGKDIECPLCRDLEKAGKPATKAALKILNQQPPPVALRRCPGCGQDVKGLVTREGALMCVGCAQALDEEAY